MTSPKENPGEQDVDLLAKLFDIRTFTGALFLIFGVLVTLVGLNASDADIRKAAGLNISLILGLIMLAMGVLFVGWMLLRPPQLLEGHDVTEEDLPEQLRHHGLEAIPEHPDRPRDSGPGH
jgi:uncharacterized membrane protein YedE/YeeE